MTKAARDDDGANDADDDDAGIGGRFVDRTPKCLADADEADSAMTAATSATSLGADFSLLFILLFELLRDADFVLVALPLTRGSLLTLYY